VPSLGLHAGRHPLRRDVHGHGLRPGPGLGDRDLRRASRSTPGPRSTADAARPSWACCSDSSSRRASSDLSTSVLAVILRGRGRASAHPSRAPGSVPAPPRRRDRRGRLGGLSARAESAGGIRLARVRRHGGPARRRGGERLPFGGLTTPSRASWTCWTSSSSPASPRRPSPSEPGGAVFRRAGSVVPDTREPDALLLLLGRSSLLVMAASFSWGPTRSGRRDASSSS
jgi:hypothetical protein